MITSDDRLQAFTQFRVDYSLPKHSKTNEMMVTIESFRKSKSITYSSSSDDSNDFDDSDDEVFTSGIVIQNGQIKLPKAKKKFFQKIFPFLKKEPPKKEYMPIVEFFTQVKNSVKELDVVLTRAEGYEKAISKANKLGQKALVERLSQNLVAFRAESHLIQMGYNKYLTEEDLVSFAKKCKKGLRLDWIRNFTRMIPDEIVEIKLACDDRYVFDNYLILHYDPENKGYEKTIEEKKQEEAARRDPILFGVMEGRNILYYLGEWEDEYCNLSLDEIADCLGQDSIKTISSDVNSFK